jgi:hypothetical protein
MVHSRGILQGLAPRRLADPGAGESAPARVDPVRRAVHVLLVLYLSPIILLVLAIAGLALLVRATIRLVGLLPLAGRSSAIPEPHIARDRRGVPR